MAGQSGEKKQPPNEYDNRMGPDSHAPDEPGRKYSPHLDLRL